MNQNSWLWQAALQYDTKSPQKNPTQLLSTSLHQFEIMTTRRTRSLDLICYKDVRCTMRIDLFTAGIKRRSLDRKPKVNDYADLANDTE